jgi:hypothetical protein
VRLCRLLLTIVLSSGLLWLLGLQRGPSLPLLRRWEASLRKATGGGGGSISKPKLGATSKLTEEQKAHNVKNGLCYICGKACHIVKDCHDRDHEKPFGRTRRKKGKKDAKDFKTL